MALKVRAIYEDGNLRLLEPVDLSQGEQVVVTLEQVTQNEDTAFRAALGDSVQWHETSDDSDAWVEDLADEIAQAFKGLRPMSEILIEERNEGW